MITALLLELQETKGKRKGAGNEDDLYPKVPALADLAKAYVSWAISSKFEQEDRKSVV